MHNGRLRHIPAARHNRKCSKPSVNLRARLKLSPVRNKIAHLTPPSRTCNKLPQARPKSNQFSANSFVAHRSPQRATTLASLNDSLSLSKIERFLGIPDKQQPAIVSSWLKSLAIARSQYDFLVLLASTIMQLRRLVIWCMQKYPFFGQLKRFRIAPNAAFCPSFALFFATKFGRGLPRSKVDNWLICFFILFNFNILHDLARVRESVFTAQNFFRAFIAAEIVPSSR